MAGWNHLQQVERVVLVAFARRQQPPLLVGHARDDVGLRELVPLQRTDLVVREILREPSAPTLVVLLLLLRFLLLRFRCLRFRCLLTTGGHLGGLRSRAAHRASAARVAPVCGGVARRGVARETLLVSLAAAVVGVVRGAVLSAGSAGRRGAAASGRARVAVVVVVVRREDGWLRVERAAPSLLYVRVAVEHRLQVRPRRALGAVDAVARRRLPVPARRESVSKAQMRPVCQWSWRRRHGHCRSGPWPERSAICGVGRLFQRSLGYSGHAAAPMAMSM